MPSKTIELRWDVVEGARPGLFGHGFARASLLFHPRERTPWLAAWDEHDGIGIWRWNGKAFELVMSGLEMGLDQDDGPGAAIHSGLLYFDAAADAPAFAGCTLRGFVHGFVRGGAFERARTPNPPTGIGTEGTLVYDAGRAVLHCLPAAGAQRPAELIGGVWRTLTLPFVYAPRSIAAGYDAARKRIVVVDFEGRRSAAWDGRAWRALGDVPASLQLERSAYGEIERSRIALVNVAARGGLACLVPASADGRPEAWLLQGTTWTPATRPLPHTWTAACFDEQANAPLLFDAAATRGAIDDEMRGLGRRTLAWLHDGEVEYVDGTLGRPAREELLVQRGKVAPKLRGPAHSAWPEATGPDLSLDLANRLEPVHCWNPELACTVVVESRRLNEHVLWTLTKGTWKRHRAVLGKKTWSRNPEAAVLGFDPPTRTMFMIVGIDWSAKVPHWVILVADGLSTWRCVATLRHNRTDRTIGLGASAVELAWNPGSRELVAVGSPHDDGHRWAVMRLALGSFFDTLASSAPPRAPKQPARTRAARAKRSPGRR